MARLVAKYADWVEIERPADAVFAAASDLERLFGLARSRSDIRAERLKGAGPTAVGDQWSVSANGRFGRRQGVMEVVALTPPQRMVLVAVGGGYEVDVDVAVAETGPALSRIDIASRIRASGLRATISAAALKLMDGAIRSGLRRALLKAKKRLEEDPGPSS